MNFKRIEGWNKYGVSACGAVKNLKTGRILKQSLNSSGYLVVTLSENSRRQQLYVHRLVASSYLSNPNALSDVNHKDGDKTHNNVDNLEWISRKGNINHAVANGLIQRKYNVQQIEETRGLLEKGYSTSATSKLTGMPEGTVGNIRSRCLYTEISKNYTWVNYATNN